MPSGLLHRFVLVASGQAKSLAVLQGQLPGLSHHVGEKVTKLRATIVLLTDRETQDFIRKLGVELDDRFNIGLFGCLLPAHVSLKQPFQIANLPAMEAFFDEWVASVEPFDVRFGGLRFPFIK
jgi:hypothetical protein